MWSKNERKGGRVGEDEGRRATTGASASAPTQTIPDDEFFAIERAMQAAERSRSRREGTPQAPPRTFANSMPPCVTGKSAVPSGHQVGHTYSNVSYENRRSGAAIQQQQNDNFNNIRAVQQEYNTNSANISLQQQYVYNNQPAGGSVRQFLQTSCGVPSNTNIHQQPQSHPPLEQNYHQQRVIPGMTKAKIKASIDPAELAKIQECYFQSELSEAPASTAFSAGARGGPSSHTLSGYGQQGEGERDATFWNRNEPTPMQQKKNVKVSLKLVGNGERFGLSLGGRNDAFDVSLRRFFTSGCSWDKESRMWTFCILEHDNVVKFLKEMKEFNCAVEPVAPFALRLLRSSLNNRCTEEQVEDTFQNIPEHLQKKLMEFQTSGVRYIIQLKGRGLIGDEMGLGKTVQALALVAAYKEHWPVLVITPSSLRIQWADAIHEWLRVTEEHVSVVSSGKDTNKLDNRFVVISYDFIPKMHHLLKEKKFQMIVCDEAHYIKNHKAKRSKDTLPLLQQAKHVVLLTGTPALSRPIELLQQLRAIHPKVVRSIKEYGDRYCTGGFFNQYNQYNGASNLKELHKVVTSTTMIRRLKKDVLSQLPSKIRQQVMLPITAAESKELKAITSKMDAIKEALKDGSADSESIFSGNFAQKTAINELYLKSGEIKSKAVCDHLGMLLEAEEKFLVFAHHKCVLNSIESFMREKKVKFIRIDGSTPANDRSGLVQKFQENEVYRAAILSIKAAGVGLTLTAASLVIMAELDWTPGNLVQAEDRAHRIGQASSVLVHYLHMKGSIDDIIWQTLQNKLENVGTLLDGSNDSLNIERNSKSSKAKRNSADTSEDSRPGKRRSGEKIDTVETQPTMETYFKPSKQS